MKIVEQFLKDVDGQVHAEALAEIARLLADQCACRECEHASTTQGAIIDSLRTGLRVSLKIIASRNCMCDDLREEELCKPCIARAALRAQQEEHDDER